MCHHGLVMAQLGTAARGDDGRAAVRFESSLACLTAPVLLSLEGGKLPTEFRIFREGLNETDNGPVTFDAAAAAAVMEAYRAHGVDLQIDLEHLSVAPALVTGDARNFDPDARGWCQLELRGGELWAVNVTWTEDGAARLRARKQRYVSPAIRFDGDRRVVKILNLAITGMPATHEAVALVASARGEAMERSELLASGESGKAAAVKEAAVSAVDALTALGKAFKGSDIDATFAAIEEAKASVEAFAKSCEALTGGGASKDPEPDESAEPPAAEPEAAAMRAAAAELFSLTGKATVGEALAVARAWQDSHRKAAEDNARLAAELKLKAEARRVELLAESIGLGYESPATAWEDPDGRTPKEEFLSMPLEALEARVAVQRENPRLFSAERPAITAAAGLSAEAMARAKARGIDPGKVAAVRAQFRTVRGGAKG